MTATLTNPLLAGIEDEKLSQGVSAILRALEDVTNKTLVCLCFECETRRLLEEEK